MTALWVGLAGAAGAMSRYGVAVALDGRGSPWGIAGVNLVGSFVLGVVVELGAARGWPDAVAIPVAVGFLGAFTPFSTFSVETWALVRDGRIATAAAYVGVSVVGGVALAVAGWALARAVS